MKKYPSFKIDFLGCKVTVIFDKDWRDIAKKMLKRDLKHDDSNGMAIQLGRDYYIFSKPSVKPHVLYHECFHVLMWIADDFGLEFDVNNQEPMAYLIEYLIEETMRIKKKK